MGSSQSSGATEKTPLSLMKPAAHPPTTGTSPPTASPWRTSASAQLAFQGTFQTAQTKKSAEQLFRELQEPANRSTPPPTESLAPQGKKVIYRGTHSEAPIRALPRYDGS